MMLSVRNESRYLWVLSVGDFVGPYLLVVKIKKTSKGSVRRGGSLIFWHFAFCSSC